MELKILQDSDPMNPRIECDNVGIMVCFHRRYRLGDETDLKESMFSGWDELREHLEKEEGVVAILPLHLYDHSGITMSTEPFTCLWDSGQVGFIYTTKALLEKMGVTLEDVEGVLKAEVKTYDQYLTGDVWGYVIEDDEGEEVDSYWGFFGRKCAEEEGQRALAFEKIKDEKRKERDAKVIKEARETLERHLAAGAYQLDDDAEVVESGEKGYWVLCRVFVWKEDVE
jgi:hypothetical protein